MEEKQAFRGGIESFFPSTPTSGKRQMTAIIHLRVVRVIGEHAQQEI